MTLKELVADIRAYEGLTRKKGIGALISRLQEVTNFGTTFVGPGDDAAAIQEDGSFLLLAADGIWKRMLEQDPYAAGRASVIVNVNDIVATGGKPIAMVNVIASPKDYDLDALLEGMSDASALYHVPMLGGHYHPEADTPELSVAIVGRTRKLLTSHTAEVGHDIIVAMDLDGARGLSFVNSWDATGNKTTEQIWDRLGIIIYMAEEDLCHTASDISNPGVLGSIAVMLSASGKGAEITVERIPRPSSVSLGDWLKMYPSYGFILCVDRRNRERCLALFEEKGITAKVIGLVTEGPEMVLHYEGVRETIFNFKTDILY